MIDMWDYHKVELVCLTPLLGSTPKNEKTYSDWLAMKQEKTGKYETDETINSVETTEQRGWTGFYGDETGLFLFDYVVKGMFKEVAAAIPEAWGQKKKDSSLLGETTIKHRLDGMLFVHPRKVYLLDASGKNILSPPTFLERPLRAQTMQGPRVSLVRSDQLPEGTRLSFTLKTLQRAKITTETVEAWLEYASEKGLGQWRTGGFGRVTGTVTPVSKV